MSVSVPKCFCSLKIHGKTIKFLEFRDLMSQKKMIIFLRKTIIFCYIFHYCVKITKKTIWCVLAPNLARFFPIYHNISRENTIHNNSNDNTETILFTIYSWYNGILNNTPAYHRDILRPPTLLKMPLRTVPLGKKPHQIFLVFRNSKNFCVFAKPQWRRKKMFRKKSRAMLPPLLILREFKFR